MNLRTKGSDRILITEVALVMMVIGVWSFHVAGTVALFPYLALCLAILLLAQVETMRRNDRAISRLKAEAVNDMRQVESLIYLVSILRPEIPLPETRDGAASPDLLRKTLELLAARRPSLVVEAGSGVSTLVIGYYLKRLGTGKLISLEHNPDYATTVRGWIDLHSLGHVAEVVDAPLTTLALGDERFLWYDIGRVHFGGKIDLVFVDGPPGGTQPLARYPALPVLLPHLSSDALILLDDGNRIDEERIAQRWTAEFPTFSSEFLCLEKGAFLFRCSSENRSENLHRTSELVVR